MKEISKEESEFSEYAFIEDENEEDAVLNIFSTLLEDGEE